MPLYGPKWPLKPGNEDTFEKYDDIKQQIGFYLKNLLLTSPGENISDPNYGVGIRRFLFEQNVASARSSMQSRISSQINRYLPYLIVEDIIIGDDADDIDNNKSVVKIIYQIPGGLTQEVYELDFKPNTTIGFY